MAGRARCRHPWRDGPRQSATRPACKRASRALRDPVATDDQPRGRVGSQSEPASRKDGVLMGLKPGYKRAEVGVIPDDWSSSKLHEASERISVGLATSVTKHYRASGVPIGRNSNIKD